MNRTFSIEIRDYEQGETPPILTPGQIEASVQQLLDSEGADGIVIVEEREADDTDAGKT